MDLGRWEFPPPCTHPRRHLILSFSHTFLPQRTHPQREILDPPLSVVMYCMIKYQQTTVDLRLYKIQIIMFTTPSLFMVLSSRFYLQSRWNFGSASKVYAMTPFRKTYPIYLIHLESQIHIYNTTGYWYVSTKSEEISPPTSNPDHF